MTLAGRGKSQIQSLEPIQNPLASNGNPLRLISCLDLTPRYRLNISGGSNKRSDEIWIMLSQHVTSNDRPLDDIALIQAILTELIHEYVLFRTMEGIDEEIFATIHPHPTLGEWLGEAVLAAKGRALNL